MDVPTNDLARLYALCLSCAYGVYGWTQPGTEYARRVAMLLMGTALHESGGLRWRRQMGFGDRSIRGGWGLWQVESVSVTESLRRLRRQPTLTEHSAEWLSHVSQGAATLSEIAAMRALDRMRILAADDAACCLFARLYYLWDPEKIPSDVWQMGAYYKRVYNTAAGAAKPQDFVVAWHRFGVVGMEAFERAAAIRGTQTERGDRS